MLRKIVPAQQYLILKYINKIKKLVIVYTYKSASLVSGISTVF